jgi:hypothetical protein
MLSIPCVNIPPLPAPQRLTLPGGASIEHLDLVQVVQPALTPLMPAFDIINAVVAAFDCIKAIPETIGPPPDPTALASAIPKLAQKVGKLLGLVPQLSLPLTVVGIIDLLIANLRKTRDQLEHLMTRLGAVAIASARAVELDDPGLADIALGAEANVAREAANLGKALGALGALVGLLNIFLGMVGAPEVPDLSSLGGKPLDQALEPLDELVRVLEAARSLVPIP